MHHSTSTPSSYASLQDLDGLNDPGSETSPFIAQQTTSDLEPPSSHVEPNTARPSTWKGVWSQWSRGDDLVRWSLLEFGTSYTLSKPLSANLQEFCQTQPLGWHQRSPISGRPLWCLSSDREEWGSDKAFDFSAAHMPVAADALSNPGGQWRCPLSTRHPWVDTLVNPYAWQTRATPPPHARALQLAWQHDWKTDPQRLPLMAEVLRHYHTTQTQSSELEHLSQTHMRGVDLRSVYPLERTLWSILRGAAYPQALFQRPTFFQRWYELEYASAKAISPDDLNQTSDAYQRKTLLAFVGDALGHTSNEQTQTLNDLATFFHYRDPVWGLIHRNRWALFSTFDHDMKTSGPVPPPPTTWAPALQSLYREAHAFYWTLRTGETAWEKRHSMRDWPELHSDDMKTLQRICEQLDTTVCGDNFNHTPLQHQRWALAPEVHDAQRIMAGDRTTFNTWTKNGLQESWGALKTTKGWIQRASPVQSSSNLQPDNLAFLLTWVSERQRTPQTHEAAHCVRQRAHMWQWLHQPWSEPVDTLLPSVQGVWRLFQAMSTKDAHVMKTPWHALSSWQRKESTWQQTVVEHFQAEIREDRLERGWAPSNVPIRTSDSDTTPRTPRW